MGTDFSAVEGTGANRVLVCAEASGENEQRDLLPLRPYARAGSIFERCIRRMGLDRKSFSVTNVIRCRPRNNFLENAPYEFSAISQCRPNLEAAIAERKPKCIVALGGVATRELTGLAGKYLGVLHLAGYVMPGPGDIPVIADYHPAYLGRGKADHQGVFSRIINRALNIAKGTDTGWLWNVDPKQPSTWGGLRYNLHPSLDEAQAFMYHVRDNPNLLVAQDIETAESGDMEEDAREGFSDTEIRLIQFSTGKGTGIAFPWEEAYRDFAMAIVNSRNPKYGHNWDLFDAKVIRAASHREGFRYEPQGVIFDTLDMFHHWQPDLAANLQAACQFIQAPFPWKHLSGSDIEFYGCCDVDNDWQLGEMLRATLAKEGLWGDQDRGYLGMVQELRPVLTGMEDQGIPIDDSARLRLGEEFDKAQQALGMELNALATGLGRIQPKEGYKGVPPEVKKWALDNGLPPVEQVYSETVSRLVRVKFKEPDKLVDGELEIGDTYEYTIRNFEIPVEVDGQPAKQTIVRWCRLYDFNPNSRLQVYAYMDLHHHTRPKNKHAEDGDGNQPDTTAAKELTRLAHRTGDTFYLKVVEYRGLTKLRGTYVEGFRPGHDGRVHPAFTFDTAIGQTSSRNPNSQNWPKLKPTRELADAMRGMIAAPDGYEISEWDYKSCHALTLAFLAEDPDYMRLTRIDVHSAVAGHMLELWNVRDILKETDDELRARFKWLKSDPVRKLIRDDQAKHAILGIGNGLKAKGLYERYMENFTMTSCPECKLHGRSRKCVLCRGTGVPSGQKIAQRFLDLLEKLFPRIFSYLESQRKQAHEQMKLVSPFLFVRRFYEVYRWDSKKSDWGHGDQSEQAVAFRHPNIAFCHIRRAMKALHVEGLAGKYGLFNNVHDSFMFCYPKELREQHVAEVYPVLVRPNPILTNSTAPGGLVIGVEASAGPRWNSMEEIQLPSLILPEVTACA